jgi:dolichol-phosphate mannosyltransferase
MAFSTVVVPTYNERENLPTLVNGILEQGDDLEILIVDDDSPDGTGHLADELAARSKRVHVRHRTGKLGLGTAYIEGFQWALAGGSQHIFSMDGDLSHDPKYLPQFSSMLLDHDVAIGSRYMNGISVVNWPLNRILLSYFANMYVRNLTGLRVRDCTSGFAGYRRQVLERLQLNSFRSEGYAFLIEMKYRAQQLSFRIGEVPIIFVDRSRGASKLSKYVMLEAFWLPWRLALARARRRKF